VIYLSLLDGHIAGYSQNVETLSASTIKKKERKLLYFFIGKCGLYEISNRTLLHAEGDYYLLILLSVCELT
jgi:hypothetical protein